MQVLKQVRTRDSTSRQRVKTMMPKHQPTSQYLVAGRLRRSAIDEILVNE